MLKRFAFLFIPFLVTSSINALMIPLSVEERTVASDTILSGKVTHIESYWNADKTVIYSKITVAVDEQFSGAPLGDSCEIQMIGGTVGNITLASPDNPKFSIGEDTVFFLTKNIPLNTYNFLGGYQAKISLDALSGKQKKALRLRINDTLKIMNE